MKRLAVLIPLYNHERFIRKAIESALDQTRPPDRVIIVDDGSKDRSVEVARSIADPRVEVHTQENQGAHNTLNRLVRMAEDCEFVSILNSDDFYDRTRFEICLRELEAHPGIAVACTSTRLVGADDAPVAETDPKSQWYRAVNSLHEMDLSLPEKLGMANYLITTSNMVARREWLLANPFQSYRYVHDYYALAWAALTENLLVIPEVLLNYRTHGSNTISTHAANLIREMLRMNFDLAAAAGRALERGGKIGNQWSAYLNMTWLSVSTSRADIFGQLLAGAASQISPEKRDALIAGLEQLHPVAFDSWPNKEIYTAFTEDGNLLVNRGLPARLQHLRDEHDRLKEEASTARKILAIRTEALGSRWYGLGALFGLSPKLHKNLPGKGLEKLKALRTRTAESAWLKLGASIGVSSARRLLEFSRSPS